MSAAVLTRPRGAARGAPAPRRTSPPEVRLLLPPLVEPEPEPVHGGAPELALRLMSVRSPLDDAVRTRDATADAPARAERALPDPRRVAGPLVLAAHEALTGTRPLAQLTRWVSPDLYGRLAGALPLTRSTAPRHRARLLSVRAALVERGVAEATVVLHDGVRVRAAAARLEEHRGRWRATVLDIG